MNMKMTSLAAVALILGAAWPALAQSPSLLETSRVLRDGMRAAAQIEDYETARRLNQAALSIQPGHSGLLNNEVLLHRLYHEEQVRTYPASELSFFCTCSKLFFITFLNPRIRY